MGLGDQCNSQYSQAEGGSRSPANATSVALRSSIEFVVEKPLGRPTMKYTLLVPCSLQIHRSKSDHVCKWYCDHVKEAAREKVFVVGTLQHR